MGRGGGKVGHTYLRSKDSKRRRLGLRSCNTEGARGVWQTNKLSTHYSKITKMSTNEIDIRCNGCGSVNWSLMLILVEWHDECQCVSASVWADNSAWRGCDCTGAQAWGSLQWYTDVWLTATSQYVWWLVIHYCCFLYKYIMYLDLWSLSVILHIVSWCLWFIRVFVFLVVCCTCQMHLSTTVCCIGLMQQSAKDIFLILHWV